MSMTCVSLCCSLGIGAIEEFTVFRLHCPYVLARMDSIGSVGGTLQQAFFSSTCMGPRGAPDAFTCSEAGEGNEHL